MKTAELQEILAAWNHDAFSSLGDSSATESDLPATCGAKIYPRSFLEGRPCYCGTIADETRFPGVLIHPTSNDAVAVGAVLDSKSPANGEFADTVVAVGINYGQFTGSADSRSLVTHPGWSNTQMRNRLERTLRHLDGKCFEHGLEKRWANDFGNFHLVAVNLFPWLTTDPWGQLGRTRTGKPKALNAITEALLLHCWGYDHPAALIESLIMRIAGRAGYGSEECAGAVPLVIFHGADNAVPYHAVETVRRLRTNSVRIFSNYVVCDNLSPNGPEHRVANAAALCPRVPLCLRQHDTHRVLDE